MKWIGAALVILGCGGFGFLLALNHKATENAFRQLTSALDFMECELRYHMTSLPELCKNAGRERTGIVRTVLLHLASELDAQVTPEVRTCMTAALQRSGEIPAPIRNIFEELGQSLGRFDLNGQLKGLNSARQRCRRELEALNTNRDVRLRSYQTLGLCTGAALAILLI